MSEPEITGPTGEEYDPNDDEIVAATAEVLQMQGMIPPPPPPGEEDWGEPIRPRKAPWWQRIRAAWRERRNDG